MLQNIRQVCGPGIARCFRVRLQLVHKSGGQRKASGNALSGHGFTSFRSIQYSKKVTKNQEKLLTFLTVRGSIKYLQKGGDIMITTSEIILLIILVIIAIIE